MLLVGTGVWKMSRLLDADVATEGENAGCLITEVVVPGWVQDRKRINKPRS
jgi:hypothetical protein